MARFYTLLSGSAPSDITTDYFDQRAIADGLTKRTRLMESRSIVSQDVYEDMNVVNINGNIGTYFPRNVFSGTDPITATAYTSSIPGIVLPTNYRTRPTASVDSTDPRVGITSPVDTVTISAAPYQNASMAVKAVLDSVTGGGPYGRLGLNPSRTLHSLWHDEPMGFFAWDDFTPGTGSIETPRFLPNYTVAYYPDGPVTFVTSSSTITLRMAWGGQFSADTIGMTTASVITYWNGTMQEITSSAAVLNGGTELFLYNIPVSSFNPAVNNNGDPRPVTATGSVRFHDITIPLHAGEPVTQSFANIGAIHRLVTLNNNLFISNDSGSACTALGTTIYAAGWDYFDNPPDGIGPAGIHAKYLFREPNGTFFTPTNVELPGYLTGAQYCVVRAVSGVPASGSGAGVDQVCCFTDEGFRISCSTSLPCLPNPGGGGGGGCVGLTGECTVNGDCCEPLICTSNVCVENNQS